MSGVDMGEAARKVHETLQLRQQFAYLFEADHRRYEDRIARAEEGQRSLVSTNADLRRQVARLEALQQHEQQKSTRSKGSRPQGRVRVIYWVTARLNAPAQVLGDLLWAERPKLNDEPETGMKVATYAVDGDTIKIVIDYTVSGNAPSDVKRMLDKATARLGVEVLDCEVIEQSRVVAPEFGTHATG